MELVAADDAGAVRAGLLHMDDGGVDLGHGHGHDLLAGDHGVLDLDALQILQLGHGLALLLADAPVLHQAGALHQADRQEGQAQGRGVQHQHQHVLGVVLVGQLALLDGSAEAAGHVGIAGVGGVAVDIGSHTALTDEHIDLAAAGAGVNDEVLLALTQDLSHSGVRLAIGGEAADGEHVAGFNELFHRIMQGIHFVHVKNLHYKLSRGSLVLGANFQGAKLRYGSSVSLPQDVQTFFGSIGKKFAYILFAWYNR